MNCFTILDSHDFPPLAVNHPASTVNLPPPTPRKHRFWSLVNFTTRPARRGHRVAPHSQVSPLHATFWTSRVDHPSQSPGILSLITVDRPTRRERLVARGGGLDGGRHLIYAAPGRWPTESLPHPAAPSSRYRLLHLRLLLVTR